MNATLQTRKAIQDLEAMAATRERPKLTPPAAYPQMKRTIALKPGMY
jgi:hypothetical protein